jgi:hypothetical protein
MWTGDLWVCSSAALAYGGYRRFGIPTNVGLFCGSGIVACSDVSWNGRGFIAKLLGFEKEGSIGETWPS